MQITKYGIRPFLEDAEDNEMEVKLLYYCYR